MVRSCQLMRLRIQWVHFTNQPAQAHLHGRTGCAPAATPGTPMGPAERLVNHPALPSADAYPLADQSRRSSGAVDTPAQARRPSTAARRGHCRLRR